jgi:hypothetical protein
MTFFRPDNQDWQDAAGRRQMGEAKAEILFIPSILSEWLAFYLGLPG